MHAQSKSFSAALSPAFLNTEPRIPWFCRGLTLLLGMHRLVHPEPLTQARRATILSGESSPDETRLPMGLGSPFWLLNGAAHGSIVGAVAIVLCRGPEADVLQCQQELVGPAHGSLDRHRALLEQLDQI